MLLRIPTTLLSLLVCSIVHASPESYEETLHLQTLPDGKVHSRFDFTMKGPWEEEGVRLGGNAAGEWSRVCALQRDTGCQQLRESIRDDDAVVRFTH